jgi:hypothetical protein
MSYAGPRIGRPLRRFDRQAALHIDRATYRIHNAVELRQQSITGIFLQWSHDGQQYWGKQALQMFPQSYMRAFFVHAGQSAVTSNIGRKNGNKPSQEVFARQGLSSSL